MTGGDDLGRASLAPGREPHVESLYKRATAMTNRGR
jgi:hypothetical protein